MQRPKWPDTQAMVHRKILPTAKSCWVLKHWFDCGYTVVRQILSFGLVKDNFNSVFLCGKVLSHKEAIG